MNKDRWLAEKREQQARDGDTTMDQTPEQKPAEATKTVEVSPALVPPGQKLEEAERLGIENLYLKMQNCQLQVQQCDITKASIIEQMRGIQAEMEAKKKALSEKYGVEIGRQNVRPDGTIVTKPGNNGG